MTERPKGLKKKDVRGRMSNFLMFIPNMLKLLGRLMKDSRVPTTEKALFVAAIIYAVSPIDLIPDVFPFIGQVDDVYVIALTLLRVITRTDASVVRQHWSGGGDIVSLAESIASMAPMLLPKRVTRIISSRVEMGKASQVIKNIRTRKEPVLVEIPEPEKLKVDSRSNSVN